ncbi:hypothetical protein [Pontibacter burrus]|uniref:Uncharacterized protein n=1 Tax=Pontibacter burrus TaxID=2704466 RepID=A0A6B3M0H8_9BACT|nr:hypothetical protein [Pontibacter burrus]NEM99137.1 hypothetical protein [Pontibacter burrus]
MLEVANLSLKLNLNVPDYKIIDIGLDSFNLALEAQQKFFQTSDGKVHVWVEQGSVKYRYKLYYGLLTLVNIMGNFDGFVGGIEKVVTYGNKAMDYITQESIVSHNTQNVIVLSHSRSLGFPGKVKALMTEVSKGHLTPEEATDKIINLLEEEENIV